MVQLLMETSWRLVFVVEVSVSAYRGLVSIEMTAFVS